jgi:hypothetical protein
MDEAATQSVNTTARTARLGFRLRKGAGDRNAMPGGTPTAQRHVGAPPIQVLIGWIAEASKKDVLAHAYGIAEDQLATMLSAWIAITPYRNGYFYEIHEGGVGKAYLPGIIELLNRDPDQIVWLPAGTAINRVMTIGITDNVPYAVILTEAESSLVRQSGQEPIARAGRMRRLVRSGQGVLVFGALLAMLSVGVLGLTLTHARGLAQQPPTLVTYLPDTLPFRQVADLASGLPDDRWLLFVLYENGTWRSETARLDPLVLPVDDSSARMIAAELRNEEDGRQDTPTNQGTSRAQPADGAETPGEDITPAGAAPAEQPETQP